MSDIANNLFPDYAYIFFSDICDIIGPSDQWPERILDLFWSKNVKHLNHFILCTFVIVNGLNPQIFLEWVDVIGMARDYDVFEEFKTLLDTLRSNPQKWNKVYGYNVINHRYEYINGKVKWNLDYAVKMPHW